MDITIIVPVLEKFQVVTYDITKTEAIFFEISLSAIK